MICNIQEQLCECRQSTSSSARSSRPLPVKQSIVQLNLLDVGMSGWGHDYSKETWSHVRGMSCWEKKKQPRNFLMPELIRVNLCALEHLSELNYLC